MSVTSDTKSMMHVIVNAITSDWGLTVMRRAVITLCLVVVSDHW